MSQIHILRDVIESLRSLPGGASAARRTRIVSRWTVLTDEQRARFRIAVCSDENTGKRYGRAACRVGRAAKIGSGGRNRNSSVRAYQIWVDWS